MAETNGTSQVENTESNSSTKPDESCSERDNGIPTNEDPDNDIGHEVDSEIHDQEKTEPSDEGAKPESLDQIEHPSDLISDSNSTEQPSHVTIESTSSDQPSASKDCVPHNAIESSSASSNPKQSVKPADDQKAPEESERELTQDSDTEHKDSSITQLPKWMVSNANASPSPEPQKEETPAGDKSAEKARGRGRGRPPNPKNDSPSGKTTVVEVFHTKNDKDDSFSQRPRRSTRTRVDYANPDAATVIAEVDDEEPGGLGATRRASRGKPVSVSRGRKRKTLSGTSEDEEEDDAGSDYGSKKTKKKRISVAKKGGGGSQVSTPKGKRGRPPSSSASGTTGKGRVGRPPKSTGPRKQSKLPEPEENESEDDDGEVVYDDHVSEKEHSDEDISGEYQIQKGPSNPTPTARPKPTSNKRGRPKSARVSLKDEESGPESNKSEHSEIKLSEPEKEVVESTA